MSDFDDIYGDMPYADPNEIPDDDDEQPPPAEPIDVDWPLPTLEPAALYGLAGEYAQKSQPYTEACVAGILFSTMIAWGNALGPSAYIDLGPRRHYVNEFGALVGPAADGAKGDAVLMGKRPIELADTDWADRILGGFGSGEALVAAVSDQDGDTITDKRALVFTEEFAQILTVCVREGSRLSDIIRNGWDHGTLECRVRDLKRNLVAKGAHVSLLAGITQDELVRECPKTQMVNGFLSRFLLVAVHRDKSLAIPPLIPTSFDEFWSQAFREKLAWARKHGGRVKLAGKDAENAYTEMYEVELRGKKRYGLAGAACRRAAPHTVRMAMILALLAGTTAIEVEQLEAALALWRYCEQSANLIFGTATGDPDADKILSALEDHEDGALKLSEINSKLFSGKRTGAEIRAKCDLLERMGKVRIHKVATAGAPATIVELNR